MMRTLLLTTVVVLATAAAARAQTAPGYTDQTVHGFTVVVNDQATATQATAMTRAMEELEIQLGRIVALGLRTDVLDKLRAVKIFVEFNQTNGAAVYHPSPTWLAANGYIPQKAWSVELSNAVNFRNWSRQNQPWIVLHELAHAYHHQVLGYNHAGILAAFARARDAGILASVPYRFDLSQPPILQRAYALTNDTEWFSEMTEAYFGENDYFPFVRSDLETFDPTAYSVVQAAWGDAAGTDVQPSPDGFGLSVYPNPVRDVLHVSTPGPARVEVFDVTGRRVVAAADEVTSHRIDLAGMPPGAYFLRIATGAKVAVRPVVRVR